MPCPRCGGNEFQIVGESLIVLQDDPSVVRIGGPSIPVVLIGCSRCGCMFQHAVNLLLDDKTKEAGQ
jgi:hypothetical protein